MQNTVERVILLAKINNKRGMKFSRAKPRFRENRIREFIECTCTEVTLNYYKYVRIFSKRVFKRRCYILDF